MQIFPVQYSTKHLHDRAYDFWKKEPKVVFLF